MEIILTIVAVVVFIAAAITNHQKAIPPLPPEPPKVEEKVLSEEASPSSVPTPPALPSLVPTPAPTQVVSNNLTDFIYPGATVVSTSNESLSLTSSDSPDTITNWYKEKIKNNGYNSRAFAETRANDKVLNKLAADNDQLSLQIEIAKDSADSVVKIQVNLTPK